MDFATTGFTPYFIRLPASPSFTCFFHLPAELRHQIIRHLVTAENLDPADSSFSSLDSLSNVHLPSECRNRVLSDSHLSRGLLRYLVVSRAFHCDVATVLFQQTSFVFDTRYRLTNLLFLNKACEVPFTAKIQHAVLHIPAASDSFLSRGGAALLEMVESGALRQLEVLLTRPKYLCDLP